MSSPHQTRPIDPESARRLAARGLRMDLVDTSDAEAFARWHVVDARGFHESRPRPESIAALVEGVAYRRTTGVWDDTAVDAASPVSTVSSWPVQLTVPGERSVTAWAISSVSVAPTHRRRGIARAMIEAELRTAHAEGVPVAALTATEATIYARFGFAPSAMAATWKIDTRRASWVGPEASGRLHFIDAAALQQIAPTLMERVRLQFAGEIEHWDHLLDRMLGIGIDDQERARALRIVRYDDASGEAQGFALYTIAVSPTDFSSNTLTVEYLVAANDDAYAGLWRFMFEIDLVGQVNAPLRSIDEPFSWQVSDTRAITKTAEGDHLWTRILDVPAALSARTYSAPGRFTFTVTDELGYADGTFSLDVDASGLGVVRQVDADSGEVDAAAPDQLRARVSLSVNDLSALYLGGVSAVTLARAGRIVEHVAGSVAAIDASFRSPVAPWLGIWF
ncbi:GNAT family N-acetyltransferase [Marisediminicola senii]|uniref:GNAT family N-acetyltransferase n=1 Tax=Marisediminicola senii TaxID=2711233 RepID=UPI0013ECA04C|nr:GNAT family N-acetyltransferase [Marisediminicola senii]